MRPGFLSMVLVIAALLLSATAVGCGRNVQVDEGEVAVHKNSSNGSQSEAIPVEEEVREPGPVVGLREVAVLPVDSGPKSVELMPGGESIFVNDLYGHKNFIFDTRDYRQLKEIPLPDEPVEADFSQEGRLAWVSLYNTAKVLVVDTEAGAIAGEVPTGSIPKEVAVSPDDEWVYIANWNSNSVTVIDAENRTRVLDIPVPGIPRGICFTPDGEFAYVCIMGGSTLTEVDVEAGHRVTRQIPCGSNPRHVIPSGDGNVLYVSNNSPGTVTLVERVPGTVLATIKVGRQARTIALTPGGRYLFVCNYGEGTVGCVDLETRAQIFTIPASNPIGMAVSEEGDRLFLANYAPPRITVYEILRDEGDEGGGEQ